MAGTRVVPSCSNLFHCVKACRPTTYRSIGQDPRTFRCKGAAFHSTTGREQDVYQQRYGSAAGTRLPPPPKPEQGLTSMPQDMPKHDASNSEFTLLEQEGASRQSSHAQQASEKNKPPVGVEDGSLHNLSAQPEAAQPTAEQPATPLDIVLRTRPPSDLQGEQHHKHPHLAPSPYEHHFDTYSLVQELAKGGFTQEQAVSLMKAVRLMLAMNLAIAKDGLVSESDVQNETYLFNAACSELRTSLQSSRHSEIQRQRTQRAHLHHEYDILNQRVSQDMLGLREELKAMFNDRKMAVQEEKQRLDSKISELNYGITVLLNSDSKSEVEGLRWVLTRRAALAIAIAASMTLISLNYSSYRSREKEEAEKKIESARKKAAEMEELRHTTPARDHGTQTAPSVAESLG